MTESPSAFPLAAERLEKGIANATPGLNSEKTFDRKLLPCGTSCAGMCCYDGSFVEPDEEQALLLLLESRRETLSQWVSIPEVPFVDSRWPNRGRQTALVPHTFPDSAGLPPHFTTGKACFLLTTDGRCSLELAARAEVKHRWHYKPIACWLFPIVAEYDGENMFRLYSERDEPYTSDSYPGFVGYSKCSRTNDTGREARRALSEELEYVVSLLAAHEKWDAIRRLRDLVGGAEES